MSDGHVMGRLEGGDRQTYSLRACVTARKVMGQICDTTDKN